MCFPELFTPFGQLLFNRNFGSLTLMSVSNFVGSLIWGVWGFYSVFDWVCGFFFLSLKKKKKEKIMGRFALPLTSALGI